jgi:hypothetical protein
MLMKKQSVSEFFAIIRMYEMKPAQPHITSLFRCLLILSGIVFFSLFPLDSNSGEYEYSHLFQYETEYDSINDGDGSGEKDADHSNRIFELLFKETAEIKDLSVDSKGLAVLKQGIHISEAASVNFSSDCSLHYKGLKLLSRECRPGFINLTSHHLFSYLLSLTGDIAINAP